jgi:hypothetical protein
MANSSISEFKVGDHVEVRFTAGFWNGSDYYWLDAVIVAVRGQNFVVMCEKYSDLLYERSVDGIRKTSARGGVR